jgi:hypothetical protein
MIGIVTMAVGYHQVKIQIINGKIRQHQQQSEEEDLQDLEEHPHKQGQQLRENQQHPDGQVK